MLSTSVAHYQPCIFGKVLVRTRWHAAAVDSQKPNAGTEERSRGLTYAATVTTLPALAGIVLGLLYTIGALVRTAELRRAGMTVRDTITLVPIEEHLARGIAVVLSPATLLIVGVAAAGGLLFAYIRATRPPRETKEPPLWLLIALIACAVLVGIVLVPFLLLTLVLAFCAVFGIFGATGARLSLRPREKFLEGLTPLSSIAAFLVAAGIIGVTEALIDPNPLPRAHLALEKGNDARGGLISVNGGIWYLDTGEDRLRAIPTSAVLASEIRSRDRPQSEKRLEQSLPTLLGWD
jgi:hypothetical protein